MLNFQPVSNGVEASPNVWGELSAGRRWEIRLVTVGCWLQQYGCLYPPLHASCPFTHSTYTSVLVLLHYEPRRVKI